MEELDRLCKKVTDLPLSSVPRGFEKGLRWVEEWAQASEVMKCLDESPPWTVGDVVNWWVDAGVAIIGLSRSAARSAYQRFAGRTYRRLCVDDDETYPPIWYAEYAFVWNHGLSSQRTALPREWREPASCPELCREALLEWCGNPYSELFASGCFVDSSAGRKWAEHYAERQRAFARATLRLLRRSCAFDKTAVPTPCAEWRVADIPGASSYEGTILRRPLHACEWSGGKLLIPGWFVARQQQGQNGIPTGLSTEESCPIRMVVAKIQALMGRLERDGEQSETARQLTAIKAEVDWKTTSGRLLEVEGGTEGRTSELVRLFDVIHKMGLAFGAMTVGVTAKDDVVARLAVTTMELKLLVLEELRIHDPIHQGGLYPPRKFDSTIDLAVWSMDGRALDARSDAWTVTWKPDLEKPFGCQLSESYVDQRAVFSAGTVASEDDSRLLDVIGIVAGSQESWDFLWRPLRERVLEALEHGEEPDFGAAIEDLRESFGGLVAHALHELVVKALEGNPRAVARLKVLHDEKRLGLRCYPQLDITEQGVFLAQAKADDPIEWRDDDIPADRDIEQFFSIDRERGRRVVSRGRPGDGSPEFVAARFEDVVRDVSEPLVAAAARLRDVTDRRRMFRGAVVEPIEVAIEAVNILIKSEIDECRLAEAFELLAMYCKLVDCTLVPRTWHPRDGSSADDESVDRVSFHETVPVGRLIVQRFGGMSEDGMLIVKPEVRKSAGVEPCGYREVLHSVGALAGDDAASKFCTFVNEFPRRVLGGQALKTLLQRLFELAWEAKHAMPSSPQMDLAVQAVHRCLEAHEMVAFSPKSLTDFHEGWLRTADGRVPRGYLAEVVRPGVRTRCNELVAPAIVNTETR